VSQHARYDSMRIAAKMRAQRCLSIICSYAHRAVPRTVWSFAPFA
jgi:hypothetical protein